MTIYLFWLAKYKEISERPMLSLPGDSKIFLRMPGNAEQKKQPPKQRYPRSVEELKKALAPSSKSR